MQSESITCLTWHGHTTVQEAKSLVGHSALIEIRLPLNYNHALFHTLNPDAPPYQAEDIDVSAGPELLSKVATVRGLEELAQLVEPVRAVQAMVKVKSPPRIIITLPDQN